MQPSTMTEKEAKHFCSNLDEWATIGGRVEDYANMVESHGDVATYYEIKKTYGDLTSEVWNGVLVFLFFGEDYYYEIKPLN